MHRGSNYIDQLVGYIKKNLKKGYTKESLKWALINQGHSKLEIERAFRKAEESLAKDAPVLKTKPKITYEVVESLPAVPESETKKPFWKNFFG